MRCIYCKSDTSYPERRENGGRCKGCKHGFAFEPKIDPLGVTDGMMDQATKTLSAEGTVVFTERNLWYELNRRLLRGSALRRVFGSTSGCLGIPLVVFAAVPLLVVLLVLDVALPIVIALVAVDAGVFIWMRRRAGRGGGRPRVAFDQFSARYVVPWKNVHGERAKLMPPLVRDPPAAPRELEPDVTGYSFDRAVITDRAETAALLLANNFHFENNCAVLSVDGHPENVFETVMTMLRRNPTLTVFALHDATAAGCALPRRLREQGWFPDPSVRVVDLGLRRRQAEQLGLIRPKGPRHALSDDQRAALTPEEVAWFESGESAELAALRPMRLMRSVFQGFAAASRTGSDGSSTDGDGDGFFIWTYSDRADVYATDSFG
jgi:hypothetical protein